MHSVLPRPSTSGHNAPRKSSSYMSLQREKERSKTMTDPYFPSDTSTTAKAARPAYFDAYPHPSRPSKMSRSKSRDYASSMSNTDVSPGLSSQRIKSTLTFPSEDSTDDFDSLYSSMPGPFDGYSRSRATTGPSGKSNNQWAESTPALRFSGSSTQQSETPPDTPLDAFIPDFPVYVSAPTSGVEMMDALVDNMNGGDDILGSTLSRSRFGIPGHHPLYQPPLPSPPPGVVLGGGKSRRPKRSSKPRRRSSFSDEDDEDLPSLTPPRRRKARPATSRSASSSTLTSVLTTPYSLSEDDSPSRSTDSFNRRTSTASEEGRKASAPSISEIIRAYSSSQPLLRSKSSRISLRPPSSHGHSTVHEESEPEPNTYVIEEESEVATRSSVDSIADEIQKTLKTQTAMRPTMSAPPPSSYSRRHSVISDNASICSPRSDNGAASLYSSSAASIYPAASPFDFSLTSTLNKPASPSQAVAQYLRSARLTTLLKLTRSPHASADNPVTVSLSDLGSSTGFPVLVFLGLGCVRHIMGLYDEMAECLGLRIITIDRWGLGRTEARTKSSKGIIQWASVVEEILDLLNIEQCSVMAHSAGAPYALSFANSVPKRIRGDICLLAPWVGGGESGGYKWLKYVPNGILKTAQAAEWKLQAWMIGKPPSIAFEGIGYTANPGQNATVYHSADGQPRPSMGSNFSEYDDLRDFDGRFESRSTLGAVQHSSVQNHDVKVVPPKRKTSRSFLGRLKGSPSSQPQSPIEEGKQQPARRLKALRSMSSLKSKSSSKKREPVSPQLPPPLRLDVGLGLDDLSWTKAIGDVSSLADDPLLTATPDRYSTPKGYPYIPERSFTSANSLPGSPASSSVNSSFVHPPMAEGNDDDTSYQAMLGNALIAASHAESAKGTHNDLLQILNHDNHPWGFSYTSYPHKVRVWYGDKDEKIAEHAVRWMERTMGESKCSVKVVKGADHALMYKTGVVVEVLETVSSFWK